MHWVKQVALHAYGRVWTDKIPVNAKTWRGVESGIEAEIQVPKVRVPTVFSIRSIIPVGPGSEIGILVAYPDSDVRWDKAVTLYSCGALRWFDQWAAAVGLPVKQIAVADLAAGKLAPADEKGRSLLVLGGHYHTDGLADVVKLANDKRINILVMDVPWYGGPAGPVTVSPAQMRGELAEISKQRWPQPLKFASHRRPWPGIANRWAWIVDARGLPLVEELRFPESAVRTVVVSGALAAPPAPDRRSLILNYLPWERCLGRNESADAAILDLLAASGHRPAPDVRDVETTIVDSPKGMNLKNRPVLAAAILPPRAVHGSISPQHRVEFVKILDLRGSDEPVEYLATQRQTLQEFIEHGGHTRLLILGDNKLLDQWNWLKLDRHKKRIARAGVQWLPDDGLPPSKDNQIRLMLKLTALGVPLSPPQHEEKHK